MPTTACPTCKRAVPLPADHEPMGAFPFCSERCKMIDLGRWLDGRYQIPVEADDDEQAEAPPEADGPPPPPEHPPNRRGPPR